MAKDDRSEGARAWARRDVLSGATAALAGLAFAKASRAAHHEQSGHHAMHAVDNKLRDSALQCVTTGDDCIAHCLSEFQSDDTTLADCAVRVQELVIACRALAQLAAHRSPHLAAFAEATSGVCKACEEECRKHAKHHEVCRACAKACEHCIEECERIAA
ncbi:MAG: four-helix bundle copper-binding protein [Pseudomonadota bacterium]